MKITTCKDCGKTIKLYNSLNRRCKDCTIKHYKPIPKIGKKTEEYLSERAKWLLEDQTNGVWYCEKCSARIPNSFEVEYHHVKKRSTNPELRLQRDNCIRLCQECHFKIHNML